MTTTKEGYLLETTGRKLFTHGSDGLSPDGFGLVYGYDGHCYPNDNPDEELTIEEIKEIGNYMIDEWENWMFNMENKLLKQ